MIVKESEVLEENLATTALDTTDPVSKLGRCENHDLTCTV
jgi:hypothetical protein